MSTIDLTRPPYRAANPVVHTSHLLCGTLLARDLSRARRFYEEFLGLECVDLSPERMLARQKTHRIPGQRPFVLDIRRDHRIANPQRVFHHWGLDLDSKAAVDQMHRLLTDRKDELELQQILETRFQHGAYSFYFSDRDDNWWEFQYLPPSKLEQVFKGDAV